MKKDMIFLLVFLLLFFSCKSDDAVVANSSPVPVESVEPTSSPAPEEFVVTQDVYDETFAQIEAFMGELTQVIQKKDYDKWLSYLSKEYLDTYSSPEKLKELSEVPRLKKAGITLKSLKDYFIYVVVPSRSNVRLDKIEFIDKDSVKAFMIIKETPYLIYNLKKVDGAWKIF
ncbi:hypothetical protein WKV44_04350 [Spirochaetia bacterium 38H-sp]|uniref:Lipoprotein n=1 Tax=Rarispira pelagica TaxID=3141764 RepID=A0ABU9UAS9_9SPIR